MSMMMRTEVKHLGKFYFLNRNILQFFLNKFFFSDELCAICNIQGGKHISCYSCELMFHKKCCQQPPKPSQLDLWKCQKCAKNASANECSGMFFFFEII